LLFIINAVLNSSVAFSNSADNLVILAEYFNVSTDWILGRTDNPEINV